MRVLNFIMIIIICAGILFVIYRILRKEIKNESRNLSRNQEDDELYDINNLVEYVKNAINEITRTNLFDLGLSAEEYKRRVNKRSELKKALKGCTYGSIEDKRYVKDFINDLLSSSYLKEDNINKVL